MSALQSTLVKIQHRFDTLALQIQANHYYQQLLERPTLQRWSIISAGFLGIQLVIFGLLYLLFGKVVVIGLLASILAGFATGLGALPTLFLKIFPAKFLTACWARRRA